MMTGALKIENGPETAATVPSHVQITPLKGMKNMETDSTASAKRPEPHHEDRRSLYFIVNEIDLAASHTNQLIDMAIDQMMEVSRVNLDKVSATHLASADTLAWVARDNAKKVSDQVGELFPLLGSDDTNCSKPKDATIAQKTLGCTIGAHDVSLNIGLERFKHFSMSELLSYLNAILHVRHALTGVVNIPRYSQGKQHIYNHAGDAVEELLEFFNAVQTIVCETALDATPQSEDDRRRRALILLKAEIDAEGEIFEIAEVLSVVSEGRAQ